MPCADRFVLEAAALPDDAAPTVAFIAQPGSTTHQYDVRELDDYLSGRKAEAVPRSSGT